MFSKIFLMITIILLVLFLFFTDVLLILSGSLYFINNCFQELSDFGAIFLIVFGLLMIIPDIFSTIVLKQKFTKIKKV